MLVPGVRRGTLLLGGSKHREEAFLLDMGSFARSLYMMSDVHKMVVATESMAESLKRMNK